MESDQHQSDHAGEVEAQLHLEVQPRPAILEEEEVQHPTTDDAVIQDQQLSHTELGSIPPARENEPVDILPLASPEQDDVGPTDKTDVEVQLDVATAERMATPSAHISGEGEQHQSIALGGGGVMRSNDVWMFRPTNGERDRQQSTPVAKEDTTRSSNADVVQPTMPVPRSSPRALTTFPLSLHDATIQCVCPSGTTRLAKDIAFVGATKDGPKWAHVPCKPFNAAMSSERVDKFKASAHSAGAAFNPHKHMAQLLGHAPNEKQRLLLKHFTSTYHCDGPCKDSKQPSDFILCQKCCAWQHKPCILYGDRQDRGGPVCNRCYMIFLLHRDEIVAWQRHRLLQAVKEGWDYLKNPENRHQEWRRAWIRRWLARFFEHNQVAFHRYNVARQRAERLAAAQAYYSRIKVMPQVGQTQPTRGQPAGIKKEDGQAGRRKSVRRKQPERKQPAGKAQLAEPNDDAEKNPDAANAGDSDEIVVASSAKNKNRAAHSKAKAKPHPARSNGKRVPGKRRASSSLSPSPLAKKKKKKPDARSRAPRKTAPTIGSGRTFGRLDPSRSGEDDGDDESDKDEEPDQEEMFVQKGCRTMAASEALISCRCPGEAPTARDCFKCRDCGMHQHYACANDVNDGLSVVCNFCHVRSLVQSPASPPNRRPKVQGLPPAKQPPKPNPERPAPAPPQQTVQPPQQYDPALQDEVNHLCATVLWREYCSIPMPDEDEPVINPASRPAPPDWLAECQDRLMSLLTAAGQQQTTKYLAPALAAWPRQNHQIMKALRELAIEEIFYGLFRKKRKELGLVLEVLGLEEKGTVWKGGKA